MTIRIATVEDARFIQKIYKPYVEKTAVTFEYDVPGIDNFRSRISNTLEEYPYLVATEHEEIIGYAYASSFHSRAAYKHAAEISIYIDENWHKKGVGKQLYQELEQILTGQNVFILYAWITTTERKIDENLTNASLCFHNKMGYSPVGKHNLCGYKFNKWYSVVCMEKLIASRPDCPDAFVPFSRLNKQSGMNLCK